MEYTKKQLEKHLAEEHRMSPFSTYLQEIVYGGIDGIVTTFAVVAGFAGASGNANIAGLGYLTVLLFGLANLFADATSMGLGNFLSLRSEQDRYRRERDKEMYEIKNNKIMEQAETVQLLKQQGFTKEQATSLVSIYSTNPTYWADFMMKYELEMADPTGDKPHTTAFVTFVSFQAFGVIPLIPYIFFGHTVNVWYYAIFFTVVALFILGILRWRVTKQTVMRSIGEVLFMGSISATVAYIVGTLFQP